MRILAFAVAVLVTLPALAQQRRQTRPTPAAAETNWGIPIGRFADSFNETARANGITIRASRVRCARAVAEVCSFEVGGITMVATARGNPQGVRELTLMIDNTRAVNAIDGLSAFGVLLLWATPQATPEQRRVAFSDLFPEQTNAPTPRITSIAGATIVRSQNSGSTLLHFEREPN